MIARIRHLLLFSKRVTFGALILAIGTVSAQLGALVGGLSGPLHAILPAGAADAIIGALTKTYNYSLVIVLVCTFIASTGHSLVNVAVDPSAPPDSKSGGDDDSARDSASREAGAEGSPADLGAPAQPRG